MNCPTLLAILIVTAFIFAALYVFIKMVDKDASRTVASCKQQDDSEIDDSERVLAMQPPEIGMYYAPSAQHDNPFLEDSDKVYVVCVVDGYVKYEICSTWTTKVFRSKSIIAFNRYYKKCKYQESVEC